MKRILTLLLTTFLFINSFSQNLDYRWEDHLSYYDLSDLCLWNRKIVASSEFALVIYDVDDNSISKFSKVHGLYGEKISAINSVENINAIVVAYQSGVFSIIYSDGTVKHVTDIKSSTYSGTKSINHITEYGENIYLATDFGIVEYNGSREEFGDTYYFGPGGQAIQVNSIAVLGENIYAATLSGVYRAGLNDPFLVDYTRWELQQDLPGGNYTSIAEINGSLLVNLENQNSDAQYIYTNSAWTVFSQVQNVSHIKSFNNKLTVSSGNRVLVYDEFLKLTDEIYAAQDNNFIATSALSFDGSYFISSSNIGLLSYENSSFINLTPKGPQKNYSFRVRDAGNKIYLLYGYYNDMYAPRGRYMGYEIYDGRDWNYIDRSNLGGYRDLVDVSVNPLDENNIFFTSWSNGVVELLDNKLVETYNHTNSTIQKLYYAPDPNYVSIRIGGSAYDKDANLWIANAWNVEKPVVMFDRNRNWYSFALKGVAKRDDNGMGDLIIDENSVKYIPTRSDGIYVYHEGESLDAEGDDKSLIIGVAQGKGSLPSSRVNTIAVDKDNILWIGTEKGLVVFTDTDNIFNLNEFDASPVIIEENGVGKILLGTQKINKIVVDGSNNKWIATSSGGAYYVSENGQKTIYHFTEENSALLSNSVIDIGVNPENGRVYFVTDNGLVSFLGNATEGSDKFSDVMAYPNPVPPGYSGDVFIKGLSDGANVKITDINGNLVFETTSEGGQAIWNTRSLNGKNVSSGVYLVFAISRDGKQTAVTKILKVN